MGDQAAGLLSSFLRRRRFAAVRPHLRGRVLDVGSGVGGLAAHVSPDRYVGIDVDGPSLDAAARAWPEHRFAPALGEVGGDFDTVVLLALIEHVAEPAEMLARLAARLAPGGRLVLTTPHPSMRGVHDVGARLGIFSREAADEHEAFLDRTALAAALRQAGLAPVAYRRFLLGANQLAVGAASAAP